MFLKALKEIEMHFLNSILRLIVFFIVIESFQQEATNENPFYLPEDFEIFKMKEIEKNNVKQQRLDNLKKKVWEKGIKNKGMFTVGKLKEICKLDDEETNDQRY